MHPYTNRLAAESSPYLLQHAHNPVDWYPWGLEAFEKAIRENKPVLVSIGYAACHWCHVMERESFEDPAVAEIMNREFVNIKVDREERPDVDHMYMDAVQAVSGSGGWPLNVFLTPDKKPFYGGTYFPPRRAFNRSSWTEVLSAIADAYRNRKDEILKQADNIVQHLQSSNNFGLATSTKLWDWHTIDDAFHNVLQQADKTDGGFGRAPKFPQTFTINFLFRFGFFKKNEEARQLAELSLKKMIYGGIYDQLGGGFARYSTDAEWLAPHFEKMLYDNALLVTSMSAAFQLTRDETYKKGIVETLAFIERELMHESGGFYSALDADSEGEEGKFYVWTYDEVQDVLGADAELFSSFYDITPAGNWNEGHHKGRNILRVKMPMAEFADSRNMSVDELNKKLSESKSKLLEKRSQRVRPGLDDKILLSWNALMNLAYSHAYAATGDEHYKSTALRNAEFLLKSFYDGEWKHSWKGNQARHPAFLDDMAYLIAALIELGSVSSQFHYFDRAAEITNIVLEQFTDEHDRFFYYTGIGQKDLPVRKKEIYDGATPSGNSVMVENLLKLSLLLDRPDWRQRAESMLEGMGDTPAKYPTSFAHWLCVSLDQLQGYAEIAITGPDAAENLKSILSHYYPNRVIMASETASEDYPLLAGKPAGRENHMFLCKNYACLNPVFTVKDFVKLLDPQ